MNTPAPAVREFPLISHRAAVYCGISGIMGGLLLFMGDMLLFYAPVATDKFEVMGHLPAWRIVLSGQSALLAVSFYVLACGQIQHAFEPTKKWLRWTVCGSFVFIMLAYGVVHGAFIAVAVAAQIAVDLDLPAQALSALAVTSNDAIRQLVYPVFGLFSVLFVVAVWTRQTAYPRWLALCSPATFFVVREPLVSRLPENLQSVVDGGYLNLIIVVFFSLATSALWMAQEPK